MWQTPDRETSGFAKTERTNSRKSKSSVLFMQYATPVKHLPFLARLEFLCMAVCVTYYCQYKKGPPSYFRVQLEPQILSCPIVKSCRVHTAVDCCELFISLKFSCTLCAWYFVKPRGIDCFLCCVHSSINSKQWTVVRIKCDEHNNKQQLEVLYRTRGCLYAEYIHERRSCGKLLCTVAPGIGHNSIINIVRSLYDLGCPYVHVR